MALERERQTPRHAHGRTAGFIFCLANEEQGNQVGTTESKADQNKQQSTKILLETKMALSTFIKERGSMSKRR